MLHSIVPASRTITTIADRSNTITLGLTATKRLSNPPWATTATGVYAAAGGDIADGALSLARRTFDLYTNAAGGSYTYDCCATLISGG